MALLKVGDRLPDFECLDPGIEELKIDVNKSRTINCSGAINTGLGSTVRVKLMLEIKQAVTKGSLSQIF